jgi:hypothetical protein
MDNNDVTLLLIAIAWFLIWYVPIKWEDVKEARLKEQLEIEAQSRRNLRDPEWWAQWNPKPYVPPAVENELKPPPAP